MRRRLMEFEGENTFAEVDNGKFFPLISTVNLLQWEMTQQ